MAAPITHIVLALQILSLLPSHFDIKEFIVGTSFPDIRYAAKMDRKKTHFEPVSWTDVLNAPTAFHGGMLFHNLVDILRIKYFEPLFYHRLSLQQYSTQYIRLFPLAMKIAEDKVLHDKTNEWQQIVHYFDTIYDAELEICPDARLVKKWHSELQNYLLHAPARDCIFLEQADHFTSDSDKVVAKQHFDSLVQSEDFKAKAVDFYNHFVDYLPRESVTTPRNA
jgi:hypothetical protein